MAPFELVWGRFVLGWGNTPMETRYVCRVKVASMLY